MCLVSEVLDIRLNTLMFVFLATSVTHSFAYIIEIVTTTTVFVYFNTVRIK